MLTTLPCQNGSSYYILTDKPRTWTDNLVRTKERSKDMRFDSVMLGACRGQVNLVLGM